MARSPPMRRTGCCATTGSSMRRPTPRASTAPCAQAHPGDLPAGAGGPEQGVRIGPTPTACAPSPRCLRSCSTSDARSRGPRSRPAAAPRHTLASFSRMGHTAGAAAAAGGTGQPAGRADLCPELAEALSVFSFRVYAICNTEATPARRVPAQGPPLYNAPAHRRPEVAWRSSPASAAGPGVRSGREVPPLPAGR